MDAQCWQSSVQGMKLYGWNKKEFRRMVEREAICGVFPDTDSKRWFMCQPSGCRSVLMCTAWLVGPTTKPSGEKQAETLQGDGVDMVGTWCEQPIETGPTQLGGNLGGI